LREGIKRNRKTIFHFSGWISRGGKGFNARYVGSTNEGGTNWKKVKEELCQRVKLQWSKGRRGDGRKC